MPQQYRVPVGVLVADDRVASGRRADRVDVLAMATPSGLERGEVLDQAFAYHPTSTYAVGANGDPSAALDSKFRVRDVGGLQGVDAQRVPEDSEGLPRRPRLHARRAGRDFVLPNVGRW